MIAFYPGWNAANDKVRSHATVLVWSHDDDPGVALEPRMVCFIISYDLHSDPETRTGVRLFSDKAIQVHVSLFQLLVSYLSLESSEIRSKHPCPLDQRRGS